MNLTELMKKRFSTRSYLPKQIEEAKLQQILEAGRIAPTAANHQPQRILVVQSEEGLKKASEAVTFYNAPLLFIVCADQTKVWVRPFDNKNMVDIDASIVTDHMMLKATELGLNTLWMTYFKPDVIRSRFNIPEHIVPVNILAVGYSDAPPASPDRHKTERLPLSALTVDERF